jgi:hypothetical protein
VSIDIFPPFGQWWQANFGHELFWIPLYIAILTAISSFWHYRSILFAPKPGFVTMNLIVNGLGLIMATPAILGGIFYIVMWCFSGN